MTLDDRKEFSSCPFYRWGTRDSERPTNLLKVTCQLSRRAGIPIEVSGLQRPSPSQQTELEGSSQALRLIQKHLWCSQVTWGSTTGRGVGRPRNNWIYLFSIWAKNLRLTETVDKHSRSSVLEGDWFQDTLKISNFTDVQVSYKLM